MDADLLIYSSEPEQYMLTKTFSCTLSRRAPMVRRRLVSSSISPCFKVPGELGCNYECDMMEMNRSPLTLPDRPTRVCSALPAAPAAPC